MNGVLHRGRRRTVLNPARDDLELAEMDYEDASEDWRLHGEHAFDYDAEEMAEAQRLRAIGFYEAEPGKWIERRSV